ncbi:putative 3TM holin [compost metagenome]
MVDPWTLAAASVCSAICVRIAAYSRKGARYRFGISLLAYFLCVGTGCYAVTVLLDVLRGGHQQAVSPFLLIVLLALALLVYRAKGNVARVFYLGDGPWDGVDRRRAHK